MKKGTRVSWTDSPSALAVGQTGYGRVITDEDDGFVLVAVDSAGALHFTIWCAVTWLTVLP